MQQISYSKLIQTLDSLNIKHKNNYNRRGFLSIICPLHNDKDFGNAAIDINTGVINCFNCKQSKHIIQLIIERLNLTYKEALSYLDLNQYLPKHPTENLENKNNIYKTEKENTEQTNISLLNLIKLQPLLHEYTKIRGFTEEFCNNFNITLCIGDYYNYYMIIPIIDFINNVNTFEARRLEITERNIFLNKVLYPMGTRINNTIFNNNNLDRDEDLILCEGIGSIPKIYNNISKNVTSCFGSQITDKQIYLLKNFNKKIIILSDYDEASFKMINNLNKYLNNLYVFNVETDDKLNTFVEDIKNSNIVTSAKFLIKILYKS